MNSFESSIIYKLLKPLIKVLLKHGVSFGEFQDISKKAYVDVAESDFGIPGRKTSMYRISTITGIRRKEVSQLIKQDSIKTETSKPYNRAARVLSGWVCDKRFIDSKKKPKVLNINEGPSSFEQLCQTYSGDVNYRAILDELLRIKAVEKADDKKVILLTPDYIPRTSNEDILNILGVDVPYLISTIDHNLDSEPKDRHLQRKVYYDALPTEILPKLRSLSKKKGQKLLEYFDSIMREADLDIQNKNLAPEETHQAAIGIYYYEKPNFENSNNKER